MADHRRFFINPDHIVADEVTIEGSVARQISRVLRLKPADNITLLDGVGGVYYAQIVEISAQSVLATIIDKQTAINEPSLRLVLASCIPKSDRIEHIVQKCTELGISEMALVQSQRTVVRLDESGQEKRLVRLRKIAAEAAEQCGRSIVPKLRGVIDFAELIQSIGCYDLSIIAWEDEARQTTLRDVLRLNRQAKSALLIIGPEGGLTHDEVEASVSAGAVSVSFGDRILRTDTAAIAGCAAVMYELEGQL